MRRAPAVSLTAALLAALLSGCNGDATTKNDVNPGPSKGSTASLSPGPRTPGTQSGGADAPGSN